MFGSEYLAGISDENRFSPPSQSVDDIRAILRCPLCLLCFLLHGPRASAAVLPGPAHAEVTRLEELAVAGAPLLEVGDVLLRQVLLQPGPHQLAEGDVPGRVVQVNERAVPMEVPAVLARERNDGQPGMVGSWRKRKGIEA